MTDNRMIQELRGCLCQLLKVFKQHITIPKPGSKEEQECLKAIRRAEYLLSETRKRKENKRRKVTP